MALMTIPESGMVGRVITVGSLLRPMTVGRDGVHETPSAGTVNLYSVAATTGSAERFERGIDRVGAPRTELAGGMLG